MRIHARGGGGGAREPASHPHSRYASRPRAWRKAACSPHSVREKSWYKCAAVEVLVMVFCAVCRTINSTNGFCVAASFRLFARCACAIRSPLRRYRTRDASAARARRTSSQQNSVVPCACACDVRSVRDLQVAYFPQTPPHPTFPAAGPAWRLRRIGMMRPPFPAAGPGRTCRATLQASAGLPPAFTAQHDEARRARLQSRAGRI